MFEHKLGYVEWLTKKFYEIAGGLGLHLAHKPMDHVWMAIFILLFFTVFFLYWKNKYNVYPSFMQQVLETYYRFIENMVKDIIGPKGLRFIPVIGTLGLFILFSNLWGLFPLFKSPTASINVTFACAVFIFIYYHAQGIREQGIVNYLKHFAGPVWWLAPLFIPVEIIGHFSRPLSLTFRLFGNIFGEDTVILILFMLVPFFAPLPMMCLAIFTSLIQTLVFIMLSSIYIAGAIAHEESHHHEEEPQEHGTSLAPAPAH